MIAEKRSEYAKAWGCSFEVPPKTRWLTADFRGYVFASESNNKPEAFKLCWGHDSSAVYVGRIKTSSDMVWQDMVEFVGNDRYRLDQHVSDEVSKVIDYCSSVIAKNKAENSAYFAQMIKMIGDKIASKLEK